MGLREQGFFSVDAVFAVTLVIMITALFTNAYMGREQAAKSLGAGLEARAVGEKLAASINTVYANGPKFELRVDLPPRIGGYGYSISFDNSTRSIVVENQQSFGTARVAVACKNLVVQIGDLSKPARVYWSDNNVMVVSA